MKLENQVTNKEISQKLQKLGVKQESLFWWFETPDSIWEVTNDWGYATQNGKYDENKKVIISAFTVAELGEMLPDEINFPLKNGKKRAHNHRLHFGKCENYAQGLYRVVYSSVYAREIYSNNSDKEADARGKMFIYLLENNLITP